MATRIAWFLNLDADLELGAQGGYTPTKNVLSATKVHAAALARSLLAPEDVLVEEGYGTKTSVAAGLLGRAFCPTPRALAILRHAGALPEASPPLEVLRRVNSRAFASALGPTLPGAAFVTEFDDARTMVGRAPPVSDAWRVKHAFGMAGRNQRVVPPASRDENDWEFVRRAVARGGAQIEPNVVILEEYAIHGFLTQEGGLEEGMLVRQSCDERGAWLSTSKILLEEGVPLGVRERMLLELREVASALRSAGYFGPFGIDAYSYRGPSGATCLQPRSEINARYSMGFAVGFGRRS